MQSQKWTGMPAYTLSSSQWNLSLTQNLIGSLLSSILLSPSYWQSDSFSFFRFWLKYREALQSESGTLLDWIWKVNFGNWECSQLFPYKLRVKVSPGPQDNLIGTLHFWIVEGTCLTYFGQCGYLYHVLKKPFSNYLTQLDVRMCSAISKHTVITLPHFSFSMYHKSPWCPLTYFSSLSSNAALFPRKR